MPVCTLLKPSKHVSACSASYSNTTCHPSHYKMPLCISSLSLAVAPQGPTKYFLVKYLLICEMHRFEKII